MNESEARKLIVEVGRLMYDRSYVVGSDGNVSIRLDESRILATPTMTSKGRMREDDLAVTDIDGNPLSDKKASSELHRETHTLRERQKHTERHTHTDTQRHAT